MALDNRQGWVSYQQMVAYVATQTNPLGDRMNEHDAWTLNQLTVAQRADRAARLAAWGVWIAAGALVLTAVALLVHLH